MADFIAYSAPDEAAAAVQDFLRSTEGRKLPKDVQDQAWGFLRPGSSVAFIIAYFAELVYARRNDIDSKVALALAASCAALGSLNGIENLGGGRGNSIMQQLRRGSGERAPMGMKWQDKTEAVEPSAQFLPQVPHKPVPPAPVTTEAKALPARKGRKR